jgi:hypothetical protein
VRLAGMFCPIHERLPDGAVRLEVEDVALPVIAETFDDVPVKLDYRHPIWLYFGEGKERWGAPNPVAEHADSSGMASAYHYLVWTCPDTKTAIKKLRAIRAAVKKELAAKRIDRV